MADESKWYVRMEDGKVYGPAGIESLVEWAKDGRVEPTSFVSQDRKSWRPAQTMSELEMKWLVETEPGKVFGPFNRAVVIGLFKDDSVARTAKAYRLHEFAVDEDPPPVEKEVIKEVRVEVPVEVEKIVEKIVEKEVVKEVRVEVPPPARTELVVAEVVEPIADTPPPRAPGSIFGNASREQLAALEAAARRELSSANRRHMSFGLFGGKRK